ncbi:MAG TPA: hypothetical protein VH253_20500 [Phycisphaerae bacterium]|nr:hypothetical protein [Phycisphaerae bacterium]
MSAPRSSLTAKGLWLIGLGLLANAAVSLYTHATNKSSDLSIDQKALAQALESPNPQAMLGARGIYMMPAQIGPSSFGAYLMDLDSQTIVVYQVGLDANNLPRRLHLLAARSFRNDRFLEDWNTDTPNPTEVQALVTQQRQRKALQNQTGQPTVDQTPPPSDQTPPPPPINAPDLPK